ncbi:TMEM165/GDT1 family protein [Thermocoleostomius sinensis]|uniref:GDT1 family protein n=1 Tax=Thermocoleostomius sinensis A174 TaxID=2016057 RepID=A0A9E8ZKA6_9CYAN|nr:TMEM165/GDT1 family protein [Thermocoleostomius sinensis]WAL60056.1 TMEM165/GDT1 family protein [Thermocoleostomius sinensis A174]
MELSVISRSATPTLEGSPTHSLPSPPSSHSANVQLSPPVQQNNFRQALRVFLSTFITIFLAELGDKTQVTTLLMSAESQSPWVVFLGAGAALVATSLLGVWLGHWLSKRISTRTLETAAGAMLLLIAVMLLWDVVQG